MNEAESEWAEVFGESELQELAAELSSVSNEQELEFFLGGLFKKIGKALGKVVHSPIGRAIGGALKFAATKILPIGRIASAASAVLGQELEAMELEERELEVSKQFVRMAAHATADALNRASSGPAHDIAANATLGALQRYAPGLFSHPGEEELAPFMRQALDNEFGSNRERMARTLRHWAMRMGMRRLDHQDVAPGTRPVSVDHAQLITPFHTTPLRHPRTVPRPKGPRPRPLRKLEPVRRAQ